MSKSSTPDLDAAERAKKRIESLYYERKQARHAYDLIVKDFDKRSVKIQRMCPHPKIHSGLFGTKTCTHCGENMNKTKYKKVGQIE